MYHILDVVAVDADSDDGVDASTGVHDVSQAQLDVDAKYIAHTCEEPPENCNFGSSSEMKLHTDSGGTFAVEAAAETDAVVVADAVAVVVAAAAVVAADDDVVSKPQLPRYNL